MIPVSMYSAPTLMMSLAVAVLMQPLEVRRLEASIQQRPAIAGNDAWKTDFS